jgi:hypothetical protein
VPVEHVFFQLGSIPRSPTKADASRTTSALGAVLSGTCPRNSCCLFLIRFEGPNRGIPPKRHRGGTEYTAGWPDFAPPRSAPQLLASFGPCGTRRARNRPAVPARAGHHKFRNLLRIVGMRNFVGAKSRPTCAPMAHEGNRPSVTTPSGDTNERSGECRDDSITIRPSRFDSGATS